jgi:Flp pilus assembly protein TadG
MLRRARQETGAAAVEFALVAGLLFMLLFGIVDLGWMVNRSTMVNNASREGAREAALNPDRADVEAVTRSALSGLPSSRVTVEVTCEKPPPGGTCDVDAAGPAELPASGDVAIVTVSYEHHWLTPLVAGLFGEEIDLTKSTEMRIE